PVPPPTPTACPAPAAAPSSVQTAAPKVIIEVPPPNVIIKAAGGCGEKECFLKQICNWGCKQHVCHPHYTFQMAPVAPMYAPVAPMYAPVAPTYAPVAPTYVQPVAPTYAPVAPAYAPVAPAYAPVAPTYYQQPVAP